MPGETHVRHAFINWKNKHRHTRVYRGNAGTGAAQWPSSWSVGKICISQAKSIEFRAVTYVTRPRGLNRVNMWMWSLDRRIPSVVRNLATRGWFVLTGVVCTHGAQNLASVNSGIQGDPLGRTTGPTWMVIGLGARQGLPEIQA